MWRALTLRCFSVVTLRVTIGRRAWIRCRRQSAHRRFEFEYAGTSEDETTRTPSLRTPQERAAANGRTAGFQLYLTTRGGFYRERLDPDEETAFEFNNGGGAKINLAGPIRARVDYRIFSLKGNPRHKTVQRIYAGSILHSERAEGRWQGHKVLSALIPPTSALSLSASQLFRVINDGDEIDRNQPARERFRVLLEQRLDLRGNASFRILTML